MTMRTIRQLTALALAAMAFAASPAAAQTHPTRPITLVVPFPAGGGNDALARLVGERMSKTLGQQVVVENRGGAGGTVATRAIAKAPPDGHTILLTYTGTLAINPTLYPNAGYDPRKDFVPIGSIGTLASVLVTHPSLPVRSTADLIRHGKANPGKINYGFVPGTVGHISTEMFARSAGITLTHVPYKGNGNAIADLLGGHIQKMFNSILPVIGNIQGGKLSAPGGTPRPIVERLNKDLQAALADETLRQRLAREGGAVLAGSPADYAAVIDAEEKRGGPLVRSLNLTVD
jgi:tripartite-type tricarboxylate transporter receptor subunit TctC